MRLKCSEKISTFLKTILNYIYFLDALFVCNRLQANV